MFSAFNTFGRMGAPAGRTLAQQIAAMSPSLWLEPSVTNGYQDSAGTTALTQPGGGSADPPVGLAIDLSQGLALGPERINSPTWSNGYTTNGAIQIPTGWVSYGQPTSSTVVPNLLTFSGGHLSGFDAGDITVIGKCYEIRVKARKSSQASVSANLKVYTGSWINIVPSGSNVNQWYEVVIKSVVTNSSIILSIFSDTATIEVEYISVREIKGNHALQSTSTARPKLSSRVNLLVGTATLSTQSVTVVAGSHTIFWTGAGTVTASGVYVGALTSGQTFTTTAGTLTLTVAGSVTSAQLNIGATAQRYQAVTDANTYDYSGFPLYWKFDGVDDYLATGKIDLTGTDRVTVVAGVMKNNADNVQAICDFPYGFGGSTAGGFSLWNGDPNTGGADKWSTSFQKLSGGGPINIRSGAVFPPPATAVLTALLNVDGSTTRDLRVNGVSAATDAYPLGTSTFGNLTLALSRPVVNGLNGNIYALLVFPRTLTAPEIATVERYVAQLSGVTL